MTRFTCLLGFGLLFLLGVQGQSQTVAKKENTEVEVTFDNGSVLRMALIPSDIEVETQYGKLAVPVRDVRRIDFGLHWPEGVDKKVGARIAGLSSPDFKEREQAVRELVTLGRYAYAALVRAAKGPDLEASKRAQEALAQIRAKVSAKDLLVPEEDKIVTPRFTIVGRILTTSIKAKSEYFEETAHPVTKLRQLRVLVESRDTDLALDAGKFAQADHWLDTGVALSSATHLSVSASGEVELRPSLPGMYVCTPRGYTRTAAVGAFAKARKFIDGPARAYPGTLLGRIGEKGEPFVIGERFEGMPEREGNLYVQIMPSTYDTTASGSYQVKVSVRD